jgi:hypothetical protein
MGVVAPYQQGCHAELVVAPAAQVLCKDIHLTMNNEWT